MPETVMPLTDELASLIWSGAEITPQTPGAVAPKPAAAPKQPPAATPAATTPQPAAAASATEPEEDEDEQPEGGTAGNPGDGGAAQPAAEDDITKIFAANKPVVKQPGAVTAGKTTPESKSGNLIEAVNTLIQAGELLGYENDAAIKDEKEAIELLKLNLAEKEKQGQEGGFKEKIKSYSPQVQAILHYADQGAQTASQLMELLGAMKSMEESYELDASTAEGQETIVRQYYKSKGFKDAYIEKQLNLIKDSGANNLKEQADSFLPDLVAENEQKVQQRLQTEAINKRRAEEASAAYLDTIAKTLGSEKLGDVPLSRQDKSRVYAAVAKADQTAINGKPTTEFVKKLEELQFGQAQDYQHFLNIVRYTIDPKGFVDSLRKGVESAVTEQTIKTLRQTKQTTPNSGEPQQSSQNSQGKKTIKKGFVNPFD